MRPYGSLRGRREFALAMRRGTVAGSPAMTVYVFSPPPRLAGAPKVGVIVTRKVGTAVVRNRVRRRCKAILSTMLVPTDPRWYVVNCKPVSASLPFDQLRRQLTRALPKTGGPARG